MEGLEGALVGAGVVMRRAVASDSERRLEPERESEEGVRRWGIFFVGARVDGEGGVVASERAWVAARREVSRSDFSSARVGGRGTGLVRWL